MKRNLIWLFFILVTGPLIAVLLFYFNGKKDLANKYITKDQGSAHSRQSLELKRFMTTAPARADEDEQISESLRVTAENLRKEASKLDKAAETLSPPEPVSDEPAATP